MPQPHTDRRLLPSTANALRWAATLLAVLFATGQPGCAAGPSERETAEVARRAGQRAVSEGGVVGLSIGIARDGRLIYAEGFGHADLERTRPVTSETNFDIASVGKQFTAVAILRLAEMGNLSLSDRLRDYVPEAPAHVPNATIAEWLHHTSGFVGGELDEFNPPEWYQRPVESKELLRDVALQTGQTVFRPSEVFNYCNPGYVMLGLVVEAASGRSYERFVREELFAPAGLRSATVYRRAEPEQMADSINRGEDGYKLMPLIDFSAYAGQGSVTAGVLDLIRWELALQDGRVIDARSFEYFRTPAVVRGTHETGFMPYGAGQKLGDFHGHAKVGHTGTYDGGSAVLAHYPEDGLTIAVATNTRGPGVPYALEIESEIARAILGVQSPPLSEARTPLNDSDRAFIGGHYSNPKPFETRFEGEDTLVVLRDGQELDRIVHVGERVFLNPERPGVREIFLPDGDRAGWWLYEWHGLLLDAARRVPEPGS